VTDIFLYPSSAATNDVILCDPTALCVGVAVVTAEPGYGAWTGIRYGACGPCPIHPAGVCRRMQRRNGECYCVPIAPVAKSLLGDLIGRYGTVEGNKVYLAMQDNRQGPFAPGNKYDVERRSRRRVTTARAALGGKRRPRDR
jgi:hypothetical protein